MGVTIDKSDGRKGIISSVQTPLGFFTLVVLVSEGILGGLALRATGNDFTILICGMLLVLVLLVVSVFIGAFREPRNVDIAHQKARKIKYDVFLSAILAGFQDDAKLQEEKQHALAVASCLEEEYGYTVYYAGRNVRSIKDFDAADISARADIDSLRGSRYFLMIYPQRIVSSVIFEAGMALEQCQASIYFVRKHQDLPYLMQRLTEAVGNVKSYRYEDPSEIVAVLKRHRKSFFEDIAKRAV
jgi:hypothetical protein